jgi:hypothetical protein
VLHNLYLFREVEGETQHRASFIFELFLRLRNFYCVALFIYREPDHVVMRIHQQILFNTVQSAWHGINACHVASGHAMDVVYACPSVSCQL